MSESLHSSCGCVTVQVSIWERLGRGASLCFRIPAVVKTGKVNIFEEMNSRTEKILNNLPIQKIDFYELKIYG